MGTLILNSPWLELQGSSIIRTIAMHLVDPLSKADPRRPLWLPEMPGYWQSVSNEAHGEWHLDPLAAPGIFPHQGRLGQGSPCRPRSGGAQAGHHGPGIGHAV